ncbi:hypothetical protein D3C72_2065730 [compost metagenome]
MRSAAKRRAPVAMADKFRLGAVLYVQQRQPAVTPAAVGRITGNNRVVKRIAFTFGPVWLLTFCLIHPRQPPAAGHFRFARICQIDCQENIIGKTVDQRRNIGPASANVPDTVDTNSIERKKADLAWLIRR